MCTQRRGTREHDLIRWDWIVDETRTAERVPSWKDPQGILRGAVQGYRKDQCAGSPRHRG